MLLSNAEKLAAMIVPIKPVPHAITGIEEHPTKLTVKTTEYSYALYTVDRSPIPDDVVEILSSNMIDIKREMQNLFGMLDGCFEEMTANDLMGMLCNTAYPMNDYIQFYDDYGFNVCVNTKTNTICFDFDQMIMEDDDCFILDIEWTTLPGYLKMFIEYATMNIDGFAAKYQEALALYDAKVAIIDAKHQ